MSRRKHASCVGLRSGGAYPSNRKVNIAPFKRSNNIAPCPMPHVLKKRMGRVSKIHCPPFVESVRPVGDVHDLAVEHVLSSRLLLVTCHMESWGLFELHQQKYSNEQSIRVYLHHTTFVYFGSGGGACEVSGSARSLLCLHVHRATMAPVRGAHWLASRHCHKSFWLWDISIFPSIVALNF